MPTIGVNKADLYKALGKEYTKQEFEELCFDFGIELDEDTSDSKRPIVDGVEEAPQLKIEIPANRYDMLCFEGIAMNLNIFLGRESMPNFTLEPPPNGQLQTVTVSQDTERIRPYFSAAILRNIHFTKARYESFIALQDKLHQNLARQRTLVAIGTHDLDTIEGPFTYEALPPEEIQFAPLNQTKAMNGKQMMDFYEKDKHLSRYLPIIRDSPVYPIIYDKNRTVLSMPPIINSNHSKITLQTRNVFIDITATDKTKLELTNHILVSMFSRYCSEPFTIEPVQIISPHNSQTRQTPDLTPRHTSASVSYINSICGLSSSPSTLCTSLARMCYDAHPSPTDPDTLSIFIPVTRADVLHQADIMEDAAVAYGFNALPRRFPRTTAFTAAPLPLNKLADILRLEAAMAGWAEVMPLILCSHDENYAWLNHPSPPPDAKPVRLQNPKTAEYQIVRTSLIPGLLKTIRENKRHAVPMKIFEVSDVVFQDLGRERRARNERHFAACWYGKTSGFEQVHGLLDRVVGMLRGTFVAGEEGKVGEKGGLGYWIEEVEGKMFPVLVIVREALLMLEGTDPTYLPGHSAAIYIRQTPSSPAKRIGTFGILHPTVLKKFELPFPGSVLEMDIEVFL
ncbi:phenylalanine--tRNA ligase subunit beta [Friedmanniomyces endolithicus]|uniref:Phenylalanine--tRNA ligase beta subunit n=1 Tax=Friedmanniomyces endolithicus TaxID=329885 RepID=A0AAN6FYW2_9PEZI|nr:phenylalanine--tRNA ligase subunit beta [Friedmanniomyces endolithicus]KAK0299496.1 phenylalanine--tRNA ligase subunit beta [Friedmanniomyces endolithicus]KAK0326989.1 phenylalanine--tRNA ligase subunit beta [Friedmanniomyces endolithicus]KAK1019175.1 phenylalanine--tRNA ligase subunit beta [Friedmanniomyces endolithicus]